MPRNRHEAGATRRALLAQLMALPVAALAARTVRAEAGTAARPPDLLSVADYEAAARGVLPVAHLGYLSTGVDDDRTVAWNHEAYGQWEISVRRFADVSHTDLGISLFGQRWPLPVYLPGGELAARLPPRGGAGHRARRRLSLGADDALGGRLDRPRGRHAGARRAHLAADLPDR